MAATIVQNYPHEMSDPYCLRRAFVFSKHGGRVQYEGGKMEHLGPARSADRSSTFPQARTRQDRRAGSPRCQPSTTRTSTASPASYAGDTKYLSLDQIACHACVHTFVPSQDSQGSNRLDIRMCGRGLYRHHLVWQRRASNSNHKSHLAQLNMQFGLCHSTAAIPAHQSSLANVRFGRYSMASSTSPRHFTIAE